MDTNFFDRSLVLINNLWGKDDFFGILNKALPIFIGIIIFINPLPQLTTIHEIFFYLSCAILLFLISLKKTAFSLRMPLSTAFGLFVLWSCFGLFFALNKENSIHDFYEHLIKYLILFYLIFNYFNSKSRILLLVWTIIISTSLYALSILIYYYLISGHPFTQKLGLFMGGEIASNLIGVLTLFATLLVLCLLVVEKTSFQKIILSVCLFILTIATLSTQTRGTILAMMIALFILYFKNKLLLLVFLSFVLVTIILMPIRNILTPDNLLARIKTSDRVDAWMVFGEMVKDYPITGIGFGMQTYSNEKLLNKYNERVPLEHKQITPIKAPHNIFIDVAVRTGLVGLTFFFYILFSFMQMSWGVLRYGRNDFLKNMALFLMAAFVAIIIQGMFENTNSGPPAVLLYTIFAMMAILWRLNNHKEIQDV